MAVGAETGLLREAVVYLGAALVAVPLFTRARLGPVLGYLGAGILVGPSALGLVSDPAATLRFAEFGIVLLLFVIGLELRPARLWAMRRDIFGLGTAQVLACGAALTGVVLLTTNLSLEAAVVVGLPLALSSTALVVQLLQERGELNTPAGERAFSILLLQDLAIVPLLTVVAALSRTPADLDAPAGWLQAVYTIAAIGGLVVVGRFAMNPLFELLGGRLRTREAFVMAALFTVLGSALLMASLGLSMALGAFVAGVMLADSPYRHELEADIEPFRGLLLGLFFVSVGMTLDLTVLADNWGQALLIVALLLAVKALIIALLVRLFGTPWGSAWPLGLLLAQGGEFGFVVLGAAQAGLLITGQAASLFAAVVTLSMALTPLLMLIAYRLRRRALDDGRDLDGPEAAEGGRAIVVGYGRFGQAVAQMLMARGVAVTLIDRTPDQIRLTSRFGMKVYFGDGWRVDLLRAAGAERADLLVIAVDGYWDVGQLEPIRHAFPQLKLIARAYDRRHLMELRKLEVEAVRELFESAVATGRRTLELLGVEPETAAEIEAEYRRRDGERLALQMAAGDLLVGRELLATPERSYEAPPTEDVTPETPERG